MSEPDTIVAVPTLPGAGAPEVIRVSGPAAIAVAPHTPLPRARLIDPASGGTMADVLCAVMRAPVSYASENVVEISCHGVPVVLVINKTGPTLHPTTVGINGVMLPALT